MHIHSTISLRVLEYSVFEVAYYVNAHMLFTIADYEKPYDKWDTPMLAGILRH